MKTLLTEGTGYGEDCGDAAKNDYYIWDLHGYNNQIHSYSGHKGKTSCSLESISIFVYPIL